MEEIWRPVKGYEGLYEVSSYGRVRSLDRVDQRGRFRKGGLLKLRDSDGYGIQARLYRYGICKSHNVGWLIVKAFNENEVEQIRAYLENQ